MPATITAKSAARHSHAPAIGSTLPARSTECLANCAQLVADARRGLRAAR